MKKFDVPTGAAEQPFAKLEPYSALEAVWPDIRSLRNRAVFWTATISIAITVGVIAIVIAAESVFLLGLLAFPIVGVGLSNRYVQHKMSEKLMPSLANAVGLDHNAKDKTGKSVELPRGLLPQFNTTKSEDAVTGSFGSVTVLSVEVTVQDQEVEYDRDGKREVTTTTYFKGVCVAVTGLHSAEPVIVARGKGRGGRSLRGQMAALTENKLELAEPGFLHDPALDLYIPKTSQTPSMEAKDFLKRLVQIDASLGKGDQLFSAVRQENIAAIAIRTKRNRFALGGLLTTHQKLQVKMDRALQDFAWPLQVVEALVENGSNPRGMDA